MSHESILINYSDQDISDNYFINLEQVGFEEGVTLAEMAELVDEIFELNPCVDTEIKEEPEEPEEPVEVDPPTIIDLIEFDSLIQEAFALEICGMDSEGNFIAEIRVIPSVPGGPYELKLDNGKVLSTVVTEENISNHITVESAHELVLFYPVVGEGIFEWGASSTSQPEIIRTGNTLSWDGFVTGSLEVRYPTRYDLVEVMVYGTPDYELGECKAICFYHGLVAELDIQLPEDIGDDADRGSYCDPTGSTIKPPPGGTAKPQWVTTRTDYKCVCSGTHDHYEYSNEADQWDKQISALLDQADAVHTQALAADNPDVKKALLASEAALRANAQAVASAHSKALRQYQFPGVMKDVFGEYIDCGEVDHDINDPEFYEQTCCVPPPFPLPTCVTYYRKNMGGHRMDPENVERYQNTYGKENVNFVAVGPKDGDCGYTKYQQVKHSIDCCEDVLPLEWDPEYSPNVAPALYHFLGGKGPFIIHVTGEGFSLDRDITVKKIEITSHWFRVYLLDGHCGPGTLKVTDVCDQELPLGIRSPDGYWKAAGNTRDQDSDRCGWVTLGQGLSCYGPWDVCYIVETIPEHGDCYTYYSRGLGYGVNYYYPEVHEDGEWRLTKTSCTGHRSCFQGSTCTGSIGSNPGPCIKTDSISGLSWTFITHQNCWWGTFVRENDTVYYAQWYVWTREQWSC